MKPYYQDESLTLWHGDALAVLRTLPDGAADCVVTSPPYYGLRDYGEPGQYGLEASSAEYVETMRAVFAEVRRILAKDGTLWLNLGDSYAGTGETGRKDAQEITRGGLPHYGTLQQSERHARRIRVDYGRAPKNLLGIPWRVAFALQDDGWILRNAVVWDKPNAMPESVTDRLSCTYETVFLFTKNPRYWFDLDAIREPLLHPEALSRGIRPKNGGPGPHHDEANPKGRNPGDVWTMPTQPFPEAHFAVMPPALAAQCVKAGCRPGGVVLDPFAGSCTTGMVAGRLGHRFVGIDLSPAYLDLALRTRLGQAPFVEPLPSPSPVGADGKEE